MKSKENFPIGSKIWTLGCFSEINERNVLGYKFFQSSVEQNELEKDYSELENENGYLDFLPEGEDVENWEFLILTDEEYQEYSNAEVCFNNEKEALAQAVEYLKEEIEYREKSLRSINNRALQYVLRLQHLNEETSNE